MMDVHRIGFIVQLAQKLMWKAKLPHLLQKVQHLLGHFEDVVESGFPLSNCGSSQWNFVVVDTHLLDIVSGSRAEIL